MESGFQPHIDELGQARQERLDVATRRLRLTQRLDPVLLALLALLLVVVTAVWASLVFVADRLGWFDPPILRALPDQRLLVNVRDKIASQPLLAAVFHAPDQLLYLGQRGRLLHSWDPATELWHTEHLPGRNQGFSDELELLRSGCGNDALARRSCPDPTSLWALNAANGLARRRDGQWQVLFADSTFVGADGNDPVTADLTAAALAPGNQWLLLGTAANGLGLYRPSSRTWVNLGVKTQSQLPSAVDHLRWWQDRFWIGSSNGLAYLVPDDQTLLGGPVQGLRGAIHDLDAGSELWVLRQVKCANDPETKCLRLNVLSSPNELPRTLLDEANRYRDLDLSRLAFADQAGDFLTLAGRAGLFTYDTRLHRWKQHQKLAIFCLHRASDQIIYAGFAGGAIALQQDEVAINWEVPGERIKTLVPGQNEDLLALSQAGDVWSLRNDGEVEPIRSGSSTSLDPRRFTTAIAADHKVVLMGPKGALVHDTKIRSMRDVPSSLLPEWLHSRSRRIVGSGNHIYGLPENGGVIFETDVDGIAAGHFDKIPQPIPAPLHHAAPWGDSNLGIIAGGRAFKVEPGRVKVMTGPVQPEMSKVSFNDVLVRSDDLVVATDFGVRIYKHKDRGWSDWLGASRLGDLRASQIEEFDSSLVARTADHRLFQLDPNSRTMIGNGVGLGISDSGLSDVAEVGKKIYLLGNGKVVRYDPDQRSIGPRWRLRNGRDMQLVDAINDLPVVHAGTTAWLGNNPLDPTAGDVFSLASDGNSLWTVRERAGAKYLKGYPRSGFSPGSGQCFFRNPVAMGKKVRPLDAVELSPGWFAVLTNAGLKFYSRTARTWYKGNLSNPDIFGLDRNLARWRLFSVQSHLLILTPRRLIFVPLELVRQPHSCSTEQIHINGPEIKSYRISAATVDESTQQAVWLKPDGTVWQWNGRPSELLGKGDDAPSPGSLRRVFRFGNSLLFTGGQRLWRYDLTGNRWQVFALLELPAGEGGAGLDINIEFDQTRTSPQYMVTVRGASGAYYVGTLNFSEPYVSLRQVLGPPSRRREIFGYPGSAIRDVQRAGSSWAFLLDDRVRLFDPRDLKWSDDLVFDTPDPTATLRRVGWRLVVVRKGGSEWWVKCHADAPVRRSYSRFVAADTKNVAIDRDGKIWHLGSDGSVRCWSPDTRGTATEIAAAPELGRHPISAAYRWNSLIILLSRGGLRAFEQDSSSEIALPESIAGITSLAAVRRTRDGLWLLAGSGQLHLLWWDLAGRQSGPHRLRSKSIAADRFAVDSQGRAWARIRGSWQWRVGDRFTAPLPSERTAAFFVLDGQPAVAVDKAGRLGRLSEENLISGPLLPAGIAPADIRAVLVERGRWWLQVGQELIRLTADSRSQPARISARITFPDSEIVGATEADNGLQLILDDGGVHTINQSASPPSIIAGGVAKATPYLITNCLDEVGKRVVTSQGKQYFDPVLSLEVNAPGGRLVIRRASGSSVLAGHVWPNAKQPGSLDVGWLRFNRDERSFNLRVADGFRTIACEDFVRDRRMPFDDLRAVLARRPQQTLVASPSGVFDIPANSIDINNTDLVFHEIPLAGKITATHGRFLVPDRSLRLGPGGITEKQPYLVHEVRVGEVIFREDTGKRRIRGTIGSGTGQLPAFAGKGFLWDQRRGLAWERGTLHLLTAAGIHPAQLTTSEATFDPGPQGRARTSGRITTGKRGALCFNDRREWHCRTRSGWRLLTAPEVAERALVRSADISHSDDRATVTITPRLSRPITLHKRVWGLSTDRLVAAAANRGKLWVMTDNAFEVATDGNALATGQVTRHRWRATDRLQSFRSRPAEPAALYRWHRGDTSVWNPGSGEFTTAAVPESRELAQIGRLRFFQRTNSSRVSKAIRVDTAAGPAWREFRFAGRGIPFDEVAAIKTFAGRLFVITGLGGPRPGNLGLQVYRKVRKTGLGDLEALYDLGHYSRSPRLDISEGRLLIRLDQHCVEWLPEHGIQPSDDPGPRRSVLGENHLWRWSIGPSGIRGTYKAGGARAKKPAAVVGAPFPHDRLQSIITCQGQPVSLWQNGWFTIHTGNDLDLTGAVHSDQVSDQVRLDLLCIEPAITSASGARLEGLYFLGDGRGSRRAAWHHRDGQLSEVSDTTSRFELNEMVDRPPLVRVGRLRIVRTGRVGLRFEHQRGDGSWAPLKWIDGRLSMDIIRDLVTIDGALWAITPAGFCLLERDEDNQLGIDPWRLRLITQPRVGSSFCRVTDIETVDGKTLVRCDNNSKRVFAGRLGRRLKASVDDSKAFRPLAKDPFVERSLVRTGYWEWRLTDHVAGQPGMLEARFRDEDIGLSSGRFDFDAVNSIALYEPGRVELGTAGGWYQSTTDDLHLRRLQRSEVSLPAWFPLSEVGRVGISSDDGQPLLCLEEAAGDRALLITSSELVGTTQGCTEYLGNDGLWEYTQQDGSLAMSAPGFAGGMARRELSDGRFKDDIVLGLPATASADGEVYYLVPTAAGALRLNEEGQSRDIYLALGEEEEEDQARPPVAFVDEDHGALALDGMVLSFLDQGTTFELEPFAPEGARVVGMEDGPVDLVRIHWRADGQPGWTLLRWDGRDLRPVARNTILADAGTWRKFIAGRVAWGNPGSTIELAIHPEAIRFSHPESDKIYDLTRPEPWQPVAAVLHGDRLFLIERDELSEINLGMAITGLLEPGSAGSN